MVVVLFFICYNYGLSFFLGYVSYLFYEGKDILSLEEKGIFFYSFFVFG